MNGEVLLGIHPRTGSFTDNWIAYCTANRIPYKLVDAYSNDIIKQLDGCHGFMWHWHHTDYRAKLFARQLTSALERSELPVFPSSNSSWHFDDKLGQKYIFEAFRIPHVPTHVFYDRFEAKAWAKTARYPVVFKTRTGAGAENVVLIQSSKHASRIIKKAFGRGFKQKNRKHLFNERLWQLKRDKDTAALLGLTKGLARLIVPTAHELRGGLEKDYVYFQDFIPGNSCDIRVIVIGNRAFAIKRLVRSGDFRASGSGALIHDPDEIPQECIKLAFKMANQIKATSIGFDFVTDQRKWLLIEMSYGFPLHICAGCPGYWSSDMQWHAGKFDPTHFMIEDFVRSLQR